MEKQSILNKFVMAVISLVLVLISTRTPLTATFHLSGVFVAVIFILAILFAQLVRASEKTIVISLTETLLITWIVFQWLRSGSIIGGIYCLLFVTGWVLYKAICQKSYKLGDKWSSVLSVNMIYAVIQSIIAVAQYAGLYSNIDGNFEVGGLMGNPNVLAISLTIPFLMCYASLYWDKEVRVWKWLVLLLMGFAIAITKCRSVWFAIPLGVVVFHWPVATAMWSRLKMWHRGLVVAVAVSVMVFASIELYQFKQHSADGRLLIWKVSREMVASHPFIGVGLGRFQDEYPRFQHDYFKSADRTHHEQKLAKSPLTPYNDWLLITTETGIIGLLLVAIISISFLRKATSLTTHKYLVLAMVASVFFISLVNYIIAIPVVFFQIVGIIFMTDAEADHRTKQARSLSISLKAFNTLALGILISSGSYLLYAELLGGGFLGKLKSKSPDLQSYAVNNRASIQKYPWACYLVGKMMLKEKNKEGIVWLKRSEQQSGYYGTALELGNYYLATGELQQADRYLMQARYTAPGLLRPRYSLIKCYIRQRRFDEAKALCDDTLLLGAKVQSKLAADILIRIERIKQQLERRL